MPVLFQTESERKSAGMVSHRILIVEDEAKLLSHLDRTLREEGFSTFSCATYRELEALLSIPVIRFDLVVLDRLLHGKDTAQLLPRMRALLPDTKFLVLSAINTPAEKTHLLDEGADDYVAKPFDTEELVARIRALLRRTLPEISFGNVTLNSERRSVRVNGQEAILQNREYLLLRAFIRSPGKVFNKSFLYANVWEMSADVESNVVETTVNKLRRRLEELGASVTIKSMRNRGYWIEE